MDQRQRTGGGHQAERGTWATADLDDWRETRQVELRGHSRRQDEPDDVFSHQVVDENLLSLTLQLEDHLGIQNWLRARRIDTHPAEDFKLLVTGRVRYIDLQQEAVTLCLGKRIDTLGLQRVVRGE